MAQKELTVIIIISNHTFRIWNDRKGNDSFILQTNERLLRIVILLYSQLLLLCILILHWTYHYMKETVDENSVLLVKSNKEKEFSWVFSVLPYSDELLWCFPSLNLKRSNKDVVCKHLSKMWSINRKNLVVKVRRSQVQKHIVLGIVISRYILLSQMANCVEVFNGKTVRSFTLSSKFLSKLLLRIYELRFFW